MSALKAMLTKLRTESFTNRPRTIIHRNKMMILRKFLQIAIMRQITAKIFNWLAILQTKSMRCWAFSKITKHATITSHLIFWDASTRLRWNFLTLEVYLNRVIWTKKSQGSNRIMEYKKREHFCNKPHFRKLHLRRILPKDNKNKQISTKARSSLSVNWFRTVQKTQTCLPKAISQLKSLLCRIQK